MFLKGMDGRFLLFEDDKCLTPDVDENNRRLRILKKASKSPILSGF